jgi:uncharacterized CHY-type Zn-finger protein
MAERPTTPANHDLSVADLAPPLNEQQSLATDTTPAMNPNLLPADDGMSALRARIHSLRALGLDNADVAHRMHRLMNESYDLRRQQQKQRQALERGSADGTGLLRPETPSSAGGLTEGTEEWSPRSAISEGDSVWNIRPEDCVVSYRPRTQHETEASPPAQEENEKTGYHYNVGQGAEDGEEEEEELVMGCSHYKRRVKVQCFDCKRWYPCRQCHDLLEGHRLERTKTQNMLCMLCWSPQPAAASCMHCGEESAWYYCDICKLWENDTTRPVYHCPDCGICRRGEGLGKDYHHCKVCRFPTFEVEYANVDSLAEMQRLHQHQVRERSPLL